MNPQSTEKFLTKSRFKVATECPTKLFYYGKDEYPSTLDDNEFMQALAEGGFQIGALAQCYFPDGVNIVTLNYGESLKQTNDLLKENNCVIFEAAVRFENFFIRIDILKKTGNNLDLIEVKAKSINPDEDSFLNKSGYIEKGWLPYLYDVAFQTWVIKKAFPKYKITPYLMLADKSQKASVEGLNQKFRLKKNEKDRSYVEIIGDASLDSFGEPILVSLPVQQYVDMIWHGEDIDPKKKDDETKKKFEDRAREYTDYYVKNTQYPITLGAKCKDCEYNYNIEELEAGQISGYRECWQQNLKWKESDFEKPHIFDIWNFRKKQECIDNGNYFIEDLIPEEMFMKEKKGELTFKSVGNKRQYLQIQKALNPDEEAEDIKPELFSELLLWKYPLHFIDFETSMVAIPFNKGRRPYEQIAFQFSCHTIYENGSFKHEEWIAKEPGKFPNFEFVAALKKVLEIDNGTILRFAPHENTVLRQIQKQLEESEEENKDELIEWIDTITHWKEKVIIDGKKKEILHAGERDMQDMWDLVKKYYYHRSMGGSNSIKAVLPAVLEASKFLKDKYSNPYNSNNYHNWCWWQHEKKTGKPKNPYKLLPPLFENVDLSKDKFVLESEYIEEGGAAMMAYARMQFMDMDEKERQAIIKGLLKYCELDTLAMVMIWEYWNSCK